MRKVKLVFHAQFCGYLEEVVTVDDDATDEEIKARFQDVLGMKFDDNCYFGDIDG